VRGDDAGKEENTMKQIFIALIAGLCGAIIFNLVNAQLHPANSVATLHVDEVIAWHLNQYGKQEMTDKQRKIISEKFAKALDTSIKHIAEREKVTLLVAPAVVSAVPDYTDLVKTEIGRLMKDEKS